MYRVQNIDTNEILNLTQEEYDAFCLAKGVTKNKMKKTTKFYTGNDPRHHTHRWKLLNNDPDIVKCSKCGGGETGINNLIFDGQDWVCSDCSPILKDLKNICGDNSMFDGRNAISKNEGFDISKLKVKIDFDDLSKTIDELVDKVNDKEKFEQTEESIKAERIFTRKPQSLEECSQMFKVDLNIWECTKFTCSSWDITSTKNQSTATNYAVKAEFKKRSNDLNLEDISKMFLDKVKNNITNVPVINYKYPNSGNLLEIPIMDLHLGKLAWGEETGDDFDHKVAEERFRKVVYELADRAKYKQLEKILFVQGNDFFNFDTINGTTTKGTLQDNDLRFQKMFSKGCELLVDAITDLSQIAPVDVIYIPSNHDYQTSYYAIMYIHAWFFNNPNVNVDISPKPRKYYQWGNCLLGFSHGNLEKKKIDGIMQIEASEQWGQSKYREFHLAHLHSEHTREANGLIIRNISSVTGTDAWHSSVGYVGAVKKAQSFMWNKELGLLTIENSVIS